MGFPTIIGNQNMGNHGSRISNNNNNNTCIKQTIITKY